MATPPELYDMCGLSVQIDPSIVEQVQTILKEHKISTSGLFWYEKGELAVPYKAQTSSRLFLVIVFRLVRDVVANHKTTRYAGAATKVIQKNHLA